ncbi:MAG: hypothetical protein K8T25_15020 [Planctomycetia bacterium]|nr:hypothetical protein [Planctomycetia bacterium]
MTQSTTTRRLQPDVTRPLAKLRFYIRGYVCALGLALTVVAAGVAFWVTLVVDYIFEPNPTLRVALGMVAGLGILAVLVRQFASRLAVPLTDSNLALLLERRHRQLGDRLLTAVQLDESVAGATGFDPHMLAHTRDEAAVLLRDVRPLSVLRAGPLVRSLLLAVLAAGSVLLFFVYWPAAMHTWVQRSVLMSPTRWPRDTLIIVDDFPLDAHGRRVKKVAIGSDFEVRARADTRHRIPDAMEIQFASPEAVVQQGQHQGMTSLGNAVPGRDADQQYVYKFKNLQSTVRFDVVARRAGILGKDDRVNNLWLEAVESPTLAGLTLRCTYPAYLNKKPDSLPVTGIMAVPEGTQVVIDAKASKDLTAADCQISGSEATTAARHVDVAKGRDFQLPLGTVRRDTIVLFTLHDTDGVSNRTPVRLHVRAIADQVPEVDVRLAGIGKAITPKARLPIRGRIRDDHQDATALKTWFEFRSAGEKNDQQRPFRLPRGGDLTKEADIALDVSDLDLKPGNRFSLWVKSSDACPFDPAPHVGSSSRYELEVVTESQLRALMDSTELLLRRRLEGVIAELTRTRDALGRVKSESFGTAEAAKSATREGDKPNGIKADAGKTEGHSRDLADRSLARNTIRVEEALQSCGRTSHETLEVADQFEQILLELENNRVENLEQLRSRLHEKIATPLRTTVTDEFPRFRAQLQTLNTVLAKDQLRPAAAAAARQQLDVILRQMDQVLGIMLELESYNELVAQLRVLIQNSDEVGRLTKERREQMKKELRKGLLE